MEETTHVTVLVVEDDEAVRRLAARVLARGGFSVVAAATGEEALRLCRSARGGIAVVVADVRLPDIRGPELSERIRELEPAARIVFMSGHAPEDLEDVARTVNARFLPKPFDPDELVRLVQETVEGSAR